MSNEQKKCPNCGGTKVKVYRYDETRYNFDLATGEWDKRSWDERSDYLSEARCVECDTDLLHLVPGQTLAEEPMVHRLLEALEWIVWEINEGCGDKSAILKAARAAPGRLNYHEQT